MLPQDVIDLPWDIFDTLIGFIELIIIIIPAIIVFMYYRIQSISLYSYDITNNGATFLIHNRTNRSIFISDVQFRVTENCDLGNPVISWNDTVLQLKPDDYVKIVVNYTKASNAQQVAQFMVTYDYKKIKRVRVKV